MSELIKFIVKAKKNTYAIGENSIGSSRKCSKDILFSEGRYKYLDSYFGSNSFSGQEIVYYDDKPLWCMNYYGKVYSDNDTTNIYAFLKEALKLVNEVMPYRGPEYLENREMKYYCKVKDDFTGFKGEEKIICKNKTVYKLEFHGGYIK